MLIENAVKFKAVYVRICCECLDQGKNVEQLFKNILPLS